MQDVSRDFDEGEGVMIMVIYKLHDAIGQGSCDYPTGKFIALFYTMQHVVARFQVSDNFNASF